MELSDSSERYLILTLFVTLPVSILFTVDALRYLRKSNRDKGPLGTLLAIKKPYKLNLLDLRMPRPYYFPASEIFRFVC